MCQKMLSIIVMVEFEDNRNPDYAQDGVWQQLFESLARYGFKKMNFVAHSMGNMSILFYLLGTLQNEASQLQKQVNIANHVQWFGGHGSAS